jgi:hypothetical protein
MITCKYASANENVILNAIFDRAAALNYQISLYDGEEWTVVRKLRGEMTDEQWSEALCSTGSDNLKFYTPTGEIVGTAVLVYGNEDWVLIADYTVTPDMESFLGPIFDLAPKDTTSRFVGGGRGEQ